MDVSANTIMGTNGERRNNKRWPEALKREIVAASLASSASVAVISRQYDVNANQVFVWRRRYGPATGPMTHGCLRYDVERGSGISDGTPTLAI